MARTTTPINKANPDPANQHPGFFVRDRVLPERNLTVQAAAKLVGVGRPALSTFLNGNASLTADMASRLGVAFGLSAEDLLKMQAAYDAALARAKPAPATALPYVVPFLTLKATDLEAWTEDQNLAARSRLPVLVRTLIHSTGRGLARIDFPGNDQAERPGWDGILDAIQPTPWIPEGRSGWELSTTKGPSDQGRLGFCHTGKGDNQT